MRRYPCGHGFASQEIINLLNKIKYPYNVNRLTQQEAIHMIEKHYQVQQWVESLLHERTRLMQEFRVCLLPTHLSY